MKYPILITSLFFFLLLGCQQETKRLAGYSVHGIDVSHYQGKINWQQINRENTAQKIDFVFIKATEGISNQDSLFCNNWLNARQNKIKRGAYHYFRPKHSPLLQAHHFIKTIELYPGDLPPVLDCEETDGASKVIVINRIRSWLNIIESHYGVKPIIYTNLKYYYQYIQGNFDDHPLWIAKYSSIRPQLANNSQNKFWQYGCKGSIKGIKGYVDFNVFHGSQEELQELCIKEPQLLSMEGY